jgi:uncharacterized protein YjiS (DUF1127 family)
MFVATRRAGRAPVYAQDRAPAGFETAGALSMTLRRPFKSGVEIVRLWRRRVEERRQLAEMDERDRRDLGLTRVDVIREINKPFWR